MNGLDITLLRPLWLLAPPLVALLALAARRRGALGDWGRAVDAHLLAALERRGAVVRATAGRLSPWLLAAALIGAALAGPAVERRGAETFRNLDGLVLLLDVSRSMTGDGATEARFAARQVLDAAGARQASLILYAGDAYLAAAFTDDREVLRPLLVADPAGIVPDSGSDPARGLALAGRLFAQALMLGGDIVLVTDGGGIDDAARDQAATLRAAGRAVHVVFAPSPRPAAGAPEPDEAAARALARAGGGRFATGADIAPLAAAIAEAPARRIGSAGLAALAWTDYGRAALLAAVPALLLLFRRRT